MRSRNSQTRCCASMTARRDGPRNVFRPAFCFTCSFGDVPMTAPLSAPANLAAAAMGLRARRSPGNPAPITKRWRRSQLLVPPRFGGYVPARHPALRYGLALNDHGYFWESQEILEAVWRQRRRAAASGFCCVPAS